MTHDPHKVIWSRALAVLLGVSTRTLNEWHQNGKLGPMPTFRSGRRLGFRESECRRWIEAGMPSREQWGEKQRVEGTPCS